MVNIKSADMRIVAVSSADDLSMISRAKFSFFDCFHSCNIFSIRISLPKVRRISSTRLN